MDSLAATAAEADRIARGITAAELAEGFNHLARLRKGGEPDYEQRGLGTAYLLYYAARRAGVVAAAILRQVTMLPGPVRVLDIGSGTDATSLAIAAVLPGRRIEVDAVEPSKEMASAGMALDQLLHLDVAHLHGWMDDVLSGAVLPAKRYELVVMSAVLPYGWMVRNGADSVILGERLQQRLVPGGTLLVVEPQAKDDELRILQGALDRTHVVAQRSVVELPRNGLPLEVSSRLASQWLSLPAFRSSLDDAGERLVHSAAHTGMRIPQADMALTGILTIGPSAPGLPSGRPVPVYTRAPRARSPRTRVTTHIPRRTWLIAAALASVAIATLVALTTL